MNRYIIKKIYADEYDRIAIFESLDTEGNLIVHFFEYDECLENGRESQKKKVGDVIEGELFIDFVTVHKRIDKEMIHKQTIEKSSYVEAIVEVSHIVDSYSLYASSTLLDHEILIEFEGIMNYKVGDRIYVEGSLEIKDYSLIWCRVILLAYIGEKVVTDINNEKNYSFIRNALDYCWKWIESKQAEEEKIFEFLDDEEEEDLVGIMLFANNEKEKIKYGIILGVVSYISYHILEVNKSPIPQFLEGIDERYYNCIISDVVQWNLIDNIEEKKNRITQYYEDKVKEKNYMFLKSQIISL